MAELCDYVVVLYAGEVVKQGTTDDVFNHSQHPYTRRLLEYDPSRIETASRLLPTIPGELMSLAELPPGCIFANRCEKSFNRCLEVRPALHKISGKHRGACHLINPSELNHA